MTLPFTNVVTDHGSVWNAQKGRCLFPGANGRIHPVYPDELPQTEVLIASETSYLFLQCPTGQRSEVL